MQLADVDLAQGVAVIRRGKGRQGARSSIRTADGLGDRPLRQDAAGKVGHRPALAWRGRPAVPVPRPQHRPEASSAGRGHHRLSSPPDAPHRRHALAARWWLRGWTDGRRGLVDTQHGRPIHRGQRLGARRNRGAHTWAGRSMSRWHSIVIADKRLRLHTFNFVPRFEDQQRRIENPRLAWHQQPVVDKVDVGGQRKRAAAEAIWRPGMTAQEFARQMAHHAGYRRYIPQTFNDVPLEDISDPINIADGVTPRGKDLSGASRGASRTNRSAAGVRRGPAVADTALTGCVVG